MKSKKLLAIFSTIILIGAGCKETSVNKGTPVSQKSQNQEKINLSTTSDKSQNQEKIFLSTEEYNPEVDTFCDGPFTDMYGPLDVKKAIRIAVIDSKTEKGISPVPVVNLETDEFYYTDLTNGCVDIPPTTTKFLIPKLTEYIGMKTVTIPKPIPNKILYVKLDHIPVIAPNIVPITTKISTTSEPLGGNSVIPEGSIIQGTVKLNGVLQPNIPVVFFQGPGMNTDGKGHFKNLYNFYPGKQRIYFPTLGIGKEFEFDWITGHVINIDFDL
jgi:hypothetical protein